MFRVRRLGFRATFSFWGVSRVDPASRFGQGLWAAIMGEMMFGAYDEGVDAGRGYTKPSCLSS